MLPLRKLCPEKDDQSHSRIGEKPREKTSRADYSGDPRLRYSDRDGAVRDEPEESE